MKLDIIGFDACLMAMYEVGSVMAPYANYLLGSELLEPGTGWDYSMLAALVTGTTVTGQNANANTGITEKDLADLLIAGYLVRAADRGPSTQGCGSQAGPASSLCCRCWTLTAVCCDWLVDAAAMVCASAGLQIYRPDLGVARPAPGGQQPGHRHGGPCHHSGAADGQHTRCVTRGAGLNPVHRCWCKCTAASCFLSVLLPLA